MEGNGDVLEEILVRLPVRSLLRLKATCKQWQSLIESPSFVVRHRRRHRSDYHNCLVFCYKHHFMFSLALTPPPTPLSMITPLLFNVVRKPSFLPVGRWPPYMLNPNPSPNPNPNPRCAMPYIVGLGPLKTGIYCAVQVDSQKICHVSVATSQITLCNFATRQVKFVDPFPVETAAFLNGLALSPSKVSYGFGSIENDTGIIVDYKVVVIILFPPPSHRFLSFVYSLRRRRWDSVVDVARSGMSINSLDHDGYKAAVAGLANAKGEVQTPRLITSDVLEGPRQRFLNGSWHWLDHQFPEDKRPPPGYKINDRVLGFDLSDQVFRSFEGPPYDDYGTPDRQLCDVRRGLFVLGDDRLAVICLPHSTTTRGWRCDGFDLWVMMEYGIKESWTKIYSCRLAFITPKICVLGVSTTTTTTGVVEFEKLFFKCGNTKYLCSWDGSQFSVHGLVLPDHLEFDWKLLAMHNRAGVSTYVETLESLTLS